MKKSGRRKPHLLKFVFTFLATLTGITVLGITVLLIYSGSGQKDRRPDVDKSERGEAGKLGADEDAEEVSNMAYGWVVEEIPQEERQKERQEEEEISNVERSQGRYASVLADPEYMKEHNIYAKDVADAEEVTLAFGGDFLFDPGYSIMVHLLQRPNGIHDSISEDLMQEMHNADILMLNNEFPYSNRGTPTEEKQFTFRAKPEYADILHEMGVDIVSLANNHAYDHGEVALLDTFETLEGIGIPYVGAGRNLQEAMKPVYFIANDMKIAIVSATQIERLDNPDTKEATETSAGVFRCWNPAGLLEVVAEAKENSDFVIVYIHWGTENTAELDWAQLDQAPKLAKAGADLIIGAHPHCLQPIQYVDGIPVVYSLGNFWFNSKQVDTGLLKVVLNEQGLKSLQFLPALQMDCKTSLLYGSEKERLLGYMRSISPEITIDEEGYINSR